MLSFNPAAEHILGFSAEEVIGCNINMLMPSPDREQHDGYLARYLKTGERHIIGKGREVEAQRKDGTRVPVMLSVGEVVRANGERMFTGMLRDISDLQAAEAYLRDTNRELEEQNRIKTAIAALDDHLRGERGLQLIGESVLNHLAGWMNAQVGAFFLVKDDRLELIATHAIGADVAELREHMGIGDNLLGQAVQEKRLLLITDIPEAYLSVRSGLGEASPSHLVIAPVLFEQEVIGGY